MTSPARQFWVIAHRWAGLTIAFFLIVAGITGSLLAFEEELTELTAPWHVVAPPGPGAPLLDPLILNKAVMRAAPAGYIVEGLRLGVEPGRVLTIGLSPPEDSSLPYLEAAVNPYSGEVVRIYEWGKISDGWDQIVPFIYQLHYKLALGDIGLWAFGIAAFIWTLDCFVGFYLTLPPVRWRGWGKAWRVRWNASRYRANFDLHRAGGLWLWPVLLVFAWSSVGMNLRVEIYDPVMKAMGVESAYENIPAQPARPGFKPDLDFAYLHAEQILRMQSEKMGFTVARRNFLYFDTDMQAYTLSFATSSDFADKGNWSMLAFAPDGQMLKLALAQGVAHEGAADNWLMALHMAQVGGLPYRIFVSVLGLMITMLSVTGVVIWMKKRSARLLHQHRFPAIPNPNRRQRASSPAHAH